MKKIKDKNKKRSLIKKTKIRPRTRIIAKKTAKKPRVIKKVRKVIQKVKKKSLVKLRRKPALPKLVPLRLKTPPPKFDTVLIDPEPSLDDSVLPAGRILHLPANSAGQMSTQALALRELGCSVNFCSYVPNLYKYPVDMPSPLRIKVTGMQKKWALMRFAERAAPKFGIIHFHAGQTFTQYDYTDLPQLKKLGKKLVMSFWGSEVRRLSIAKRNNPFARVKVAKLLTEREILDRLNVFSKYMDAVTVLDAELFEYLKGYFRKVYLIRNAVDHRKFTPVYPDVTNQRPLIVHAPGYQPYLKGTEHVVRAVGNLKNTLEFDYVQIEKMTNAETLQWLTKADIVVDQLQCGSYGVLSLESMLLGKPVIAYIREDLRNKFPNELPIVSANPETIEIALYDLITHPLKRVELGIDGRRYAEQYHDPVKIAHQLVTIYKSL